MAILLFSYTQVSSTCLQFLWCVDVLDERVVYSIPSISCRSANYAQVLPIVLVMLILYVIGFPIFVLVMGWRLHRQRAILTKPSTDASATEAEPSVALSPQHTHSSSWTTAHDDKQTPDSKPHANDNPCSARWAPLYSVYRLDAWSWCGMVLFRRTTIALLNVVLAQSLALRSLSFALAHVSFMLLLIGVWPFGTRLLNIGEVGAHVTLIVLSMLMTVQLPPFSSGVEALLFVIIIPPMLLFLVTLACSKLRSRRTIATSVITPLVVSPIPPNNPNHSRLMLATSGSVSAQAWGLQHESPGHLSSRTTQTPLVSPSGVPTLRHSPHSPSAVHVHPLREPDLQHPPVALRRPQLPPIRIRPAPAAVISADPVAAAPRSDQPPSLPPLVGTLHASPAISPLVPL